MNAYRIKVAKKRQNTANEGPATIEVAYSARKRKRKSNKHLTNRKSGAQLNEKLMAKRKQSPAQRRASMRNLRKARSAREGTPVAAKARRRRRRVRHHRKARAAAPVVAARRRRRRVHRRRHAREAAPVVTARRRRRRTGRGPNKKYYRRHTRGKRYARAGGMIVHGNPLSMGEIIVGGVVGTVGYVASLGLDRYMATHAFTTATGATTWTDVPGVGQSYNWQATTAPMSLQRWAAGGALAVVPLLVSAKVKSPMAKTSIQLFGIGALIRVLGKGATDALAAMTGKSQFGQRLFGDEILAQNSAMDVKAMAALNPATSLTPLATVPTPQTAANTTPNGTIGLGAGGQPRRGVGGCCGSCAAALPCTNPNKVGSAQPPPFAPPSRTKALPTNNVIAIKGQPTASVGVGRFNSFNE